MRDEPGFWWHTYKRVWKQNFKSSLVPGIVFTLLWTLVAYAAFVLPQMTTIPAGFALVLLLDMVLLLTLGSYYWMQNALFDAPVSKKLSNCVRMLLGFLPRTALSAAVQMGYWLMKRRHPALRLYLSAHRTVGAQPAGDAGSVCPR